MLTLPTVRNYLMQLPPPSPIYYSYFDWMVPFVTKIKDEFRKNSASKISYDREEQFQTGSFKTRTTIKISLSSLFNSPTEERGGNQLK